MLDRPRNKKSKITLRKFIQEHAVISYLKEYWEFFQVTCCGNHASDHNWCQQAQFSDYEKHIMVPYVFFSCLSKVDRRECIQ